MVEEAFFNKYVETLSRDDLNALIDEQVRYTISYANENSPFYRNWFRDHQIEAKKVHTHEDLLNLPIISGSDIRANQPLEKDEFLF